MQESMLFERARKMLKTADYMVYMTYPIVKENRLLVKILEEIYECLIDVVKAVLQVEYSYKRISLHDDSRTNFEVFSSECASKYGLSGEETSVIKHVFYLIERHRQSSMEFTRKDRFVILSDTLGIESITPNSLKYYLNTAKSIMKKVEPFLSGNLLKN